jgi:lipopolysaccharide/colanic/teichoic acid biosynthesis glycosyltransferase
MKTMNRSILTGFITGPVVRFASRASIRKSEAASPNRPVLADTGKMNSVESIGPLAGTHPDATNPDSPLRSRRIQPARKSYHLLRTAASSFADRLAFANPGNKLPVWKRALDIFCCLLALPALSFLALLMSTVTWLVSPGPVFFRQERIGYQGRRFKILKFRTMTVGADDTVHRDHFTRLLQTRAPMVKLDLQGDSRLIPGGWMLRASGLDELPQLINVLCGDMSLIGPRPCMPCEFAQYLPAQRERVNAVPGMTGLWQVSGKNRTTFEEMIQLDIRYARHVSLLLDLKIILLTPWAVAVQFWDTSRRRRAQALATTVEGATGRAFQEPAHPAA